MPDDPPHDPAAQPEAADFARQRGVAGVWRMYRTLMAESADRWRQTSVARRALRALGPLARRWADRADGVAAWPLVVSRLALERWLTTAPVAADLPPAAVRWVEAEAFAAAVALAPDETTARRLIGLPVPSIESFEFRYAECYANWFHAGERPPDVR